MTLYSGGGGESDRSVGIAFRHVEPPHQVVGTLTDPGCRYISTILTTWVLCKNSHHIWIVGTAVWRGGCNKRYWLQQLERPRGIGSFMAGNQERVEGVVVYEVTPPSPNATYN